MSDKSVSGDRAAATPAAPSDFIREIVAAHVAEGKYPRIHTRFPPEPNGYLHIGHAKSICLNFGIAKEFDGICNLRMDDTNPTKEEVEYVDSISEDVRWLIAGWADDRLSLKPRGKTPEKVVAGDKGDFYLPGQTPRAGSADLEPFYASDYFEQLYEYAERLIEKGLAYVCDLSPADTDAYRGAPDSPGKESPWRTRSIGESLDLFRRMRAGEYPDGTRTLRAKMDMRRRISGCAIRCCTASATRSITTPAASGASTRCTISRIASAITSKALPTRSARSNSRCIGRSTIGSLILDLPRPLPRQYEFARLSLDYTVMSKRKLMQFVNDGVVSGWDDPRMPTISGLRRRGVTPEALRASPTTSASRNTTADRCRRAGVRHPGRSEPSAPCGEWPCCGP
jgi:glutaminyl-tRNA synthetase